MCGQQTSLLTGFLSNTQVQGHVSLSDILSNRCTKDPSLVSQVHTLWMIQAKFNIALTVGHISNVIAFVQIPCPDGVIFNSCIVNHP